MPEAVIRGTRVEADTWTFVGLEAGADATALPAGPIAVPFALWKERRDELTARVGPVGAWLEPTDAPEALFDDLQRFSLVAVRFPKFTDGRGYSTAALLRRAGYRGELRAFGDLGRDQLFYLARVGFDAFALRPGADLYGALASLRDFSEVYQGSVNQPAPLFRRRATAGTTP